MMFLIHKIKNKEMAMLNYVIAKLIEKEKKAFRAFSPKGPRLTGLLYMQTF